MTERDFVTIEEAAAIQVALEAARDQARTINTDDEEAITLRDRVIDACDAAESFLEAPHAQGAERDMRDMQAALDSIGEAFAARQIGGDDISYLRAPFESLEARLGRVWRRMAMTPAGELAVEEAREPDFAQEPVHPATEERAAVINHGGTVIQNIDNSVSLIKELKLPDGLSDAAAKAAAKGPEWLTFLRDTLLDEKYRAGLLRLQAALKNLRRGALGLSILGLRDVLATIRDTVRKIEDAAPVLTAQVKASLDLAIEEGHALLAAAERLRDRAYAAADGVDLTPWPTGLRLLPPPTPGDAPEAVELVEVQRFEGGDGEVFCLAPLSATRFVSGGRDDILRLWEIGQDAPPRRMEGHEDTVWQIASLDARHVVSASNDKTLILWDTETGEALRRFTGHENWIGDVAALSPDRFVSASYDGTARLWHRERDETLAVWRHDGMALGIAALSAGTVVTGGAEDGLFLRAVDAPDPLWRDEGEEAKTLVLATRDAASFLSIPPMSNLIHAWSRDSAGPVATFSAIDSVCEDIALLSRDRAASAHDGGLGLWSLSAARGAVPLLAQADAPEKLLSVRALPSPDPRIGRLIVGGGNGYLAYWEARPA